MNHPLTLGALPSKDLIVDEGSNKMIVIVGFIAIVAMAIYGLKKKGVFAAVKNPFLSFMGE